MLLDEGDTHHGIEASGADSPGDGTQQVPQPVITSPYSIAALYQQGRLAGDAETAISEIASIQSAFRTLVNPSSGWMTPKQGEGNRTPVPRALADRARWKRYQAWRQRWNWQVVKRSPTYPWGLTASAVVISLVNEPVTVEQIAKLTGYHPRKITDLLTAALADYGQSVADASDFHARWEADGMGATYRPHRWPRDGKFTRRRKKRRFKG